jgi:phospholipid transport system substrate-binding protein
MATRYLRLKLQDSRYRYSTSCIPHHKSFLLLTISFLFFFASWAYAGVPTDQMRLTINSVLNILKNQELEKPEKTKGKRETIRKIIGDRFDFEEMTKRSLALHWRGRSKEERKEFVALFSNLLEKTYIDKIETYENESILYIDEMIDGKYAVVRTKVITKKNIEIPIDYKLIKKVDTWLVYDIVIEGVSLVNNYRTQFNKIIRTSSYEELVEKLKDKQKG